MDQNQSIDNDLQKAIDNMEKILKIFLRKKTLHIE